jgi:hypothetical protein
VDAPTKIGLNYGANIGFPHKPIDPTQLAGVIEFGDCSICHWLGLSLNGELVSEDVKITLLEGVPGVETFKTLPSFKNKLEMEIAKACFIGQIFPDDTIPCTEDVCCDGTYQVCKSNTCVNAEPTLPPPTLPPPTSPTPTPPLNGPFCIDFDCGDGYSLHKNPETRPGADRETCCSRVGSVCTGASVGSPCSLGDISSSLISNPSFEEFTSCPTH